MDIYTLQIYIVSNWKIGSHPFVQTGLIVEHDQNLNLREIGCKDYGNGQKTCSKMIVEAVSSARQKRFFYPY